MIIPSRKVRKQDPQQIETKPAERDTSPKDLALALRDYGLTLERVLLAWDSPLLHCPSGIRVLSGAAPHVERGHLVFCGMGWTDHPRQSFQSEGQQHGSEDGSGEPGSVPQAEPG